MEPKRKKVRNQVYHKMYSILFRSTDQTLRNRSETKSRITVKRRIDFRFTVLLKVRG